MDSEEIQMKDFIFITQGDWSIDDECRLCGEDGLRGHPMFPGGAEAAEHGYDVHSSRVPMDLYIKILDNSYSIAPCHQEEEVVFHNEELNIYTFCVCEECAHKLNKIMPIYTISYQDIEEYHDVLVDIVTNVRNNGAHEEQALSAPSC